MIGQTAASGGQEAAQAGPGGTAAAEEYWPGWTKPYAYQLEVPPYPR